MSIRLLGLPGASDSRESAMLETQAPGLGRSPGEENSYPLHYSCLECSMDRRAWRATVHAVTRVGHDWATNTFTLKLLHDPPRSPALQADSLPSEPPRKPIIWSIISKSHSVHLPSNVLYPLALGSGLQSRIMFVMTFWSPLTQQSFLSFLRVSSPWHFWEVQLFCKMSFKLGLSVVSL